VSEFADEVNLSVEELEQAWVSYLGEFGSTLLKLENYIDDINYSVFVVIEAYKLKIPPYPSMQAS